MKKCIVVSDSFKGTLSSLEICALAQESIPKFFPDCTVVPIPVADGGEGTVDCFLAALRAQAVPVSVSDPFGQPVTAVYARSGTRAVIEMAAAAGLPLAGDRADPERATTYGVGQLMRHAVEHGCTELLLGLGGSATNDGGCGCAAALGCKFLDREGQTFVPVGGTLDRIDAIDLTETRRLLAGVRVTAMCDIDNPLYGPAGAAYVFAPQKGADGPAVERLDRQLRALDDVLRRRLGASLADVPGAGAAGGMGCGAMAFLGAVLRPGIQTVLDTVGFDDCLAGADLVITGEGRIDGQSVRGKVISGVAGRTRPRGIPLVAIVGGVADGAEAAYDLGVTAVFGIDREAVALADYAPRSAQCYQRTLEDVLRLIRAMERRA